MPRNRAVLALATCLAVMGAGASIAAIVEPTVSGKIIDATTKAPIPGALVYGYYATVAGSLAGGHSTAEQLRSFAVATNETGVFVVPGWQQAKSPPGLRRDRFPVIAIFKPGYRTDLRGLQTIAHWYPTNARADAFSRNAGAHERIDWTDAPHELTLASSELERFQSLRAAGMGVSTLGDCGWEAYAPVLRALHEELLGIIRRTVPENDRDADGYLRSGRPHPMPFDDFLTRSAVDRLLLQFKRNPAAWKCANPVQVFEGLRP